MAQTVMSDLGHYGCAGSCLICSIRTQLHEGQVFVSSVETHPQTDAEGARWIVKEIPPFGLG